MDSSELDSETYYGSLFCMCDTHNKGVVRVSRLLDILLKFRALEDLDDNDEDPNVSRFSTKSESCLIMLKDILDPMDCDPLISLDTFKCGVQKFLLNKQEFNKSINDDLMMMESKEEENLNLESRRLSLNWHLERPQSASTPLRPIRQSNDGANDSQPHHVPSILDLSHLSSQNNSFEGVGGNSSRIDPLELQTEISELKYQLSKANEACSDLKQQNIAFQDENMQLLSHKEELEKRLDQRDVAQERIKELQIELDETRRLIVRGEDVISVQNTRIKRLERDFSELDMKNRGLKLEFDVQAAELEGCYTRIAQAEDEIERLKTVAEDEVKVWKMKERLMEDRLIDLNSTAEELHKMNDQLRKDKFELENNLIDITGNQLAQLNSTPEKSSSKCTSPESPQYNRSYLRRSLQAEIAATIERKRVVQRHKIYDLKRQKNREIELTHATTQTDTASQVLVISSWDDGQEQGEDFKRPEQDPKESEIDDDLDHKLKEKFVQEKKSFSNRLTRLFTGAYGMLRYDFSWTYSWYWEQTWKIMKQGLAVILFIVAFFIIRTLLPALNVEDPGYGSTPVIDLCSFFSKHGSLEHSMKPAI